MSSLCQQFGKIRRIRGEKSNKEYWTPQRGIPTTLSFFKSTQVDFVRIASEFIRWRRNHSKTPYLTSKIMECNSLLLRIGRADALHIIFLLGRTYIKENLLDAPAVRLYS